jgi:hypothetical protein
LKEEKTMSKADEGAAPREDRRVFLKTMVATGGAAMVAAAGGAVAADPAPEARPLEAEPVGYRETPHIRRYYDTASF